MVARSLMLKLHRAGLIVLPGKRKTVPNNAARHRAPLLEPPSGRALEWDLAESGPLEIREVRRTPSNPLWLVAPNLSLSGYRRPVGHYAQMPIMRSWGSN